MRVSEFLTRLQTQLDKQRATRPRIKVYADELERALLLEASAGAAAEDLLVSLFEYCGDMHRTADSTAAWGGHIVKLLKQEKAVAAKGGE